MSSFRKRSKRQRGVILSPEGWQRLQEAQELATLEKWILQDRCRWVGVLGMGGIGKTALSVKLAQQVTGIREQDR